MKENTKARAKAETDMDFGHEQTRAAPKKNSGPEKEPRHKKTTI